VSLWLKALGRWREFAAIVACAVQKALPQARVYLTGGAAEKRLTVASDIDVVVVVGEKTPEFEEAVEIRAKVMEEAEKLGLPLYAPIDLHIVGEKDLKRYQALKPIKCREKI